MIRCQYHDCCEPASQILKSIDIKGFYIIRCKEQHKLVIKDGSSWERLTVEEYELLRIKEAL